MASSSQPWTIQDAKAQLSHILRLAQQGTPQVIGRHEKFVVLPEGEFQALQQIAQQSEAHNIGKKLLAISPGIDDFTLPPAGQDRPDPFSDGDHA